MTVTMSAGTMQNGSAMKTTPKPNAPNSLAWTRPLGAPVPLAPPPRKGSRAARVALWTAPLATLIKVPQ